VSRLERAAAGTLTVVLLALLTIEPAPAAVGVAVRPSLPSYKGLNYGVPLTQDGDWVGTAWLRPSAWPAVRPAIAADLVFIEQHHLGRVVRLFIALDQLMDWDRSLGFRGFRAAELAHLDETLDLFDAHGIRAVAVLYDQEVISSPGNFRFAALDGRHAAMRDGYLRATEEFLARYRQRATVAAWDLFNEAYASLGTGGGRPRPPAPDPVSPGYQTSTVHSFLHDLYLAARRAAPDAPLTVSDATLYFQPQPDLTLYDDILDFYDVHVYDDHPRLEALSHTLDKPFIIGEAGAAVEGDAFADQRIEPGVVESILEQGRRAGALAVLVHSIASQNVFPATRDRLTPTGEVLASFDAAQASRSEWPIVLRALSLVHFVTTIGGIWRWRRTPVAEIAAGREGLWKRPSGSAWAAGP